jgi:hypothetical protein
LRDEQVRRYARHVLLPDVGGLGQTALLVAAARVDVSTPAGVIAASYLAAGGLGTIVAPAAGEPELVQLRAFNPDSKVVVDAPPDTRVQPVTLPDRPAWWPVDESRHPSLDPDRREPLDADRVALEFWRGAIAAVHFMTDTIANR